MSVSEIPSDAQADTASSVSALRELYNCMFFLFISSQYFEAFSIVQLSVCSICKPQVASYQ